MWYVFVFHLTFLVIIKQHRSRVHFHVMQQWRKNYFHVGRRGRDRIDLCCLIIIEKGKRKTKTYHIVGRLVLLSCGPSWSWSHGSYIYNYLCNQCISPLNLWVRIPFVAKCTRYNIMWLMVFNATFNNISVISWGSVLLLEETEENHLPVASHWQTLSHNVVSSTPHLRGVRTHNFLTENSWSDKQDISL
jgi:hypothetical protein